VSAIEWTDQTWNPVTGCDRVSPGCAHCYALELAAKFKGWGNRRYQRDGGPASGPGFGVTLHEDKLDEPLHWRKPRMVFVNSMSDLFHDEIPDRFIDRVFATMALAPQHTFQVLTKRPERMRRWFARDGISINCAGHVRNEVDWLMPHMKPRPDPTRLFDWPLPNVWLGVTIENRRFVHRADLLRETPAAVRFVSAEPLLGPLRPWRTERHLRDGREEVWHRWEDGYGGTGLLLPGIDWLIVGGESGAHHRPIKPDWVRDLRDACEINGTAFFFKQWGGRTPKSGGRELDGRTWDEMPARGDVLHLTRREASHG
jgi:protein gp37